MSARWAVQPSDLHRYHPTVRSLRATITKGGLS